MHNSPSSISEASISLPKAKFRITRVRKGAILYGRNIPGSIAGPSKLATFSLNNLHIRSRGLLGHDAYG